MTDEELQQFAGQRIKLTYNGQALSGKLIEGFEAQLRVNAPYAIEYFEQNPTLGTDDLRTIPIRNVEGVESVEALDESEFLDAEIEGEAKDQQTPG